MEQKILLNHRLLTILALGFSSGLPFVLRGSTLQAWLSSIHLNKLLIANILLLSSLPYLFKFLWAPVMDFYGFASFGKRKGWILAMQFSLACALLLLAQANPTTNLQIFGMLAVLVAFFSASQDISITAYQTEILPTDEKGLGVSYYVFAYRLAILFSGGIALVMADYWGWKVTYEMMALIIFINMWPAYQAPSAVEYTSSSKNVWQTTKDAWLDILRRDNVLILLLFIVFYKFGDALAIQFMTYFLMNDLGFTLTELGLTYKTVSFIATILGGFVGGFYLLHWNIYKALLWFGLAQAFSNLTFIFLAMTGKSFALMSATVFIENFCSGLSTAALFAFMMSLCNYRFSASQYALFSFLASAANSLLAPVAALMIDYFGWVQFYFLAFLLCFPGIIFLLFLKKNPVSINYAPSTIN